MIFLTKKSFKKPRRKIKGTKKLRGEKPIKDNLQRNVFIFLIILCLLISQEAFAQPLFIYRSEVKKNPLIESGRIDPRGQLFAFLLLPSNFPSFNDFSGDPDRWNFGFQLFFDLTPSSELLAQLITHDDGRNRTKFDWHFSLRQFLGRYLVFLVGHDSNHDSDHLSYFKDKPFYLNRNYLGLGLCFSSKKIYFEPFIWFFHHTNQRLHLDLSGAKLKQEYGFRFGLSLSPEASLSWQTIFQTNVLFARGQMVLTDLILRIQLLSWMEFSLGTSLWKDIQESPLGSRQTFYKFLWGIVLPF